MNLADLIFDSEERSARVQRVHGVVVGLVTDNQDPEGRARVKVKLPWLAEQAETDWAKVVAPMAGKDRGALFLPEVGDEVLVAFEQGDLEHPYVLGALWNAEDTPPDTNSDGKNNLRIIRSRSGHQLVFCDDADGGREKVELRTKAGHCVVLDDASGSEKIEIKDKTGANLLTLDSTRGEISIQSQMQLVIKSPQITIEADAKLKISCGGLVEISGGMIKLG